MQKCWQCFHISHFPQKSSLASSGWWVQGLWSPSCSGQPPTSSPCKAPTISACYVTETSLSQDLERKRDAWRRVIKHSFSSDTEIQPQEPAGVGKGAVREESTWKEAVSLGTNDFPGKTRQSHQRDARRPRVDTKKPLPWKNNWPLGSDFHGVLHDPVTPWPLPQPPPTPIPEQTFLQPGYLGKETASET